MNGDGACLPKWPRGAALAAAFILLGAACGKKAAPFLPVPVPAREMRITSVLAGDDEVRVEFQVPREKFSLSREEEPWSEARLLRRKAGSPQGEFELRSARREEGGYGFGERRILVDRGDRETGISYVYIAELRKEGTREWAASAPVTVGGLELPSLEGGEVRAEGREGAVAVSWPDRRQGGSGFEVWRRAEGEEQALLMTPDPLQRGAFIDTRVQRERPYCYRVRRVHREGPVTVQGGFSPEVCAASVDLTPPPAPLNLLLFPSAKGMKLTWQPSDAPDLKGYAVYRSESDGPFLRLGAELVEGTAYLDEDVKEGVLYRYRVTAVDDAEGGNESPFSGTVEAEAPAAR